tara:strand:- start:372 stop:473 length:102 start_codon:yes stop_codon:yes gene_type:complete
MMASKFTAEEKADASKASKLKDNAKFIKATLTY